MRFVRPAILSTCLIFSLIQIKNDLIDNDRKIWYVEMSKYWDKRLKNMKEDYLDLVSEERFL
jgi:hypothetical protein